MKNELLEYKKQQLKDEIGNYAFGDKDKKQIRCELYKIVDGIMI